MNTEKTKTMVFGSPNMLGKLPPYEINYNNAPLQKVSSYRYLGMTLDTYLNLNLHVNRIVSTVSSKLKQFQRMRSFLNVRAAVLVYKSMLLPLLEYGDLFLSFTSVENRKKLQTLQNKGLRCALGAEATASSVEIHGEAGLLKLKFRREQHLLNYMYDRAQDPRNLKGKSISTIKTRSQSKKLLRLKKPHTEKFKKSLAYRGPKKWNSLPPNFHYTDSKQQYKVLTHDLVVKRANEVRVNEGMISIVYGE